MPDPSDNPDVKDPNEQPAAAAPAAESSPEAAPTATPAKDESPAGVETPAAEAKPDSEAVTEQPPKPETSKPKVSPGVQKRFNELTSEKRELQERNRQLQAQLQRQMGQPLAGIAPAARKPEETADYWRAKAQQAQNEDERLAASSKYWELLPGDIEQKAVSRVFQAVQQAAENQRLSQKLTAIHERMPIFDAQGRPDPNSPVIQRVCELADEQGVEVFGTTSINYRALEYFAKDALLELEGGKSAATAAALEQQRVKTLRASAASGLESTSAPAAATPTGPVVDLEKEIASLEKQKNAGPFNAQLNTRLMEMRMRLRDARLKQPAKRQA